MIDIKSRLWEMQDLQYKAFHQKLIPTVNSQKVIGVRTPSLRAFAREVYTDEACDEFIKDLPHELYEENNLHAFLIEKIKDYDECIDALNNFLPYVDNWATCDCMSPPILAKHTDRLYEQIKIWILSGNTYTVRFAVKTLMSLYAKDKFLSEHLVLVSSVDTEEYYIKMAVAWYYATVLAFHYEDVLEFLKANPIDKWTHNKTIQKAIESYRITPERKDRLKSMRK